MEGYLCLGFELLEILNTLIEDADGHLDTKQCLYDCQDLQLVLNRDLEQKLNQSSQMVRVGHVLQHLQWIGSLCCNFDKYLNQVEISGNVGLLGESTVFSGNELAMHN